MTNMLNKFFLAIGVVVLFASSITFAQQSLVKGLASSAPTSSGAQNVKVVNTTTDPVLVRNVDTAARQPFRSLLFGNFSDDPSTAASAITPSFTVPVGKRLVITYSTINASVPAGQSVYGLLRVANNASSLPSMVYTFTFTKQGTFSGFDLYTTSQPMEIYLDPGNVAYVEVNRSEAAGTGNTYTTLSGHYVDLP